MQARLTSINIHEVTRYLACGVNPPSEVITVADCPIGRARMDSSLLACKLKRELSIDALHHMT